MKIKRSDSQSSLKAILALLIVFLALGVLVLFNSYKESIIASNSFNSFMTLSVIGLGLLLGLLFLADKRGVSKKKRKAS